MSLLDELNSIKKPAKVVVLQPVHPKGWEPGVTYDPHAGGTITTTAIAEPDPAIWATLIADWGLDPELTEVVPGSVHIRAWDTNVGEGVIERLKYYRATIRPRTTPNDRTDVEALCTSIVRRKPLKRHNTNEVSGRALVVLLSDWQIGKTDSNGGTNGTVDRICAGIDGVSVRIRELAKVGRPVDSVYLVGMGDLVEGCSGHYATQTFSVDLDDREQDRVVRRLILRAVETVAPLVDRVVVAAVPGNHGENRNAAGKAYTRITDSRDLACFETTAEVLAANPDRYGHVSVVTADAYTLTLDVGGVPIGFAHGHRGAGGGQTKIEAWWKGQALGRQPIADAQILCLGHYHHLLCSEATGRTVFQAPAMDPGSQWFTDQTGQASETGMLTFVAGTGCGARGWSDMAVLS